MKNPLTLLIVEDNPDHLKDVMQVIDGVKLPVELRTYYASDLANALAILPAVDAVMTDVFFPAGDVKFVAMAEASGSLCEEVRLGTYGESNGEKPYGMVVVSEALAASKPVVWITSTFHHGENTNTVSEWGRKLGMEMFDVYEAGDGEASHKPWQRALYGLLALMVGTEDGTWAIEDSKLKGKYFDPPAQPAGSIMPPLPGGRGLLGRRLHDVVRNLFLDDDEMAVKMYDLGFRR